MNHATRFTSFAAALDFAALVDGVIYQFGEIYKVYVGTTPQPIGLQPVWIATNLTDSTLKSWLEAI